MLVSEVNGYWATLLDGPIGIDAKVVNANSQILPMSYYGGTDEHGHS